jgi:hypothetical protein
MISSRIFSSDLSRRPGAAVALGARSAPADPANPASRRSSRSSGKRLALVLKLCSTDGVGCRPAYRPRAVTCSGQHRADSSSQAWGERTVSARTAGCRQPPDGVVITGQGERGLRPSSRGGKKRARVTGQRVAARIISQQEAREPFEQPGHRSSPTPVSRLARPHEMEDRRAGVPHAPAVDPEASICSRRTAQRRRRLAGALR